MDSEGFREMSAFDELSEHYQKMFSLVDDFHFNSQHTRDVFVACLGVELPGCVESITHEEIKDRRKDRDFSSEYLNLGFIGGDAPYKGLSVLVNSLGEIRSKGIDNWVLSVYGGKKRPDLLKGAIRYLGGFSPCDVDQVYGEMDLLIVPSICNETFGLVVLEAISRGVPVLVSSTVGAKDIIEKIDNNFIFTDQCDLKKKLENILAHPNELLGECNSRIMAMDWCFDMESHCRRIKSLYKS